uniref:G-protein coupled receptors family 1 profile domain-containing protein n=1 Tax=Meloidogyne floridensis TaxID=298350 RepID=A0A915P0Q6_9BILA
MNNTNSSAIDEVNLKLLKINLGEVVDHFKNTGPNFDLILFTGIKFVFAVLAQLLNCSLIYVTFKTKAFRDSYNILIAAICISGFFYLFTFSIQFGIAITGINLIYLKNCYFLMILPIFFVQSQYLFYLALSIDRLIVVIFPLWHMKYIQKSLKGYYLYLILIFSSISIYALFTVYTGIDLSLNISSKKLVTCSTSDPVPPFVFQVVVYFNFVSLVFYILLWIVMNKKVTSSTSTNNSSKRMTKSILAVFFLEFSGWFSNTLIRNILSWFQVSQLQTWYIMQIAGCILVPVLACYAPLLYKMSSLYGTAFYKCFGIRFPLTKESASTITNDIKIKSVMPFVIPRNVAPAKINY